MNYQQDLKAGRKKMPVSGKMLITFLNNFGDLFVEN